MNTTRLAVVTYHPTQKATDLATMLGIPILQAIPSTNANYDYVLIVDTRLSLLKLGQKHMQAFCVDFTTPSITRRCQQASRRQESLLKAMGVSHPQHTTIIDATAGLGIDSFLLASFGYKLILLERSIIMHALLDNGLHYAAEHILCQPACSRMQLIYTDGIKYLLDLSQAAHPDIIYLDPMFPERQKTAAVKKAMTWLQDIIGKDDDASQLLSTALTCAKKRVVVKRPKHAGPLGKIKPHYAVEGSRCRFDVYLSLPSTKYTSS